MFYQRVIAKLFILSAVILLSGCNPDGSQSSDTQKLGSISFTEYTVTGQVMELYPERGSMLVRHETIPGYMDEMTMPFDVPQTNEMKFLGLGDRIRFRLKVTEEEGWAEGIEILEKADPSTLPVRPTARVVRDVEPLEVGDVMPDYPLIDEKGRKIRFSDFKGKVMAFNFIFTRCPFPNFCPRMVNRFKEATEFIKSHPEEIKDWRFITISFDVDYDTPERLLDYARAYGYDSDNWSFATGELIDIDALTEQVGLMFAREPGTTEFNHNLRTVVVNPLGVISEILIGNEWEAGELIEAMKTAANMETDR